MSTVSIFPLAPEDTNRLRMAAAMVTAIELRPEVFSRQEIERAYIDLWRCQGDLIATHNVTGMVVGFDNVRGRIVSSEE